ncbi:MAG: FtsK/SpoIIIE domain-containing protein [Desulfurococcaceae archaeon]
MKLWEKMVSRILDEDISIEIQEPDLVIRRNGTYSVIRYIVASEVDYSVLEIDEAKLRSIIESYSSLLDKLPEASEVKVVKIGLDLDKFLKRLMNEMLNLKATIDVVEEPHVREKNRVKLEILRNIYDTILKGKKLTQLILVFKIRDSGRDLSEVKKRLSVTSNIVINVLRNEFGVVAREADADDIRNIVKYEIGLEPVIRGKSIVLDSDRLGCLAPIPRFKKPRYNEDSVILGSDLETGWVVELPLKILDKHILVLGPTGRGKTTFLASLIESLITMSNIRVFGIDFKGDLVSLLNGILDIVKPCDYPINVFVKPDVFDNIEWFTSVADALSNVLGLDKDFVMEILVKNRSGGGVKVDEDVLKKKLLLFSNISELVMVEPKYSDLVKLMEKNIVMNMDGYGSSFQNLYASLLIHIYRKTVVSRTSSNTPRSVIVIDEAWRVSKLKGLVELVKEGRSRGVGVILASQNPSDIPREIVENTNMVVMFGSINEDYQKDAQKILGVPAVIAKKLSYLGVGEALVINALNPHYVVLKVRPPVKLLSR